MSANSDFLRRQELREFGWRHKGRKIRVTKPKFRPHDYEVVSVRYTSEGTVNAYCRPIPPNPNHLPPTIDVMASDLRSLEKKLFAMS